VSDPEVHSIATATHGRVLVRPAANPRGVLVGFHGYLENAAIHLARLESIPGADAWTLVSVQALNRVYRGRTQEVVASWMTREDRDATIADNIAYVKSAVRAVPHPSGMPVVYAGFSQGGQMALRAGARADTPAAGIVSVGSDVPPELLADAGVTFPPVLLARGDADHWYTAAKHDADVAALRARGVSVEPLVYGGPHEWTGEVAAAVGEWLARLR